jgi:hypothetical protein
MNLDDAQRQKVTEWIAQGLKLSDIQTRLASELGIRMTYMEARLLVDDLKLTPKDAEPLRATESVLTSAVVPPSAGARAPANQVGAAAPTPAPAGGGAGRVSISVDQLTRPGAVVSGKVTFSDGNTAAWQIDQTGQLGLIPSKAGYRPPASDMQSFQMALEDELSKLGF